MNPEALLTRLNGKALIYPSTYQMRLIVTEALSSLVRLRV